MTMKVDLLRSVGAALYGRRWQVQVADDLGVTYRSVARWLATGEMPDDIPARLRPIVRTRVSAVEEARRLLWSKARG